MVGPLRDQWMGVPGMAHQCLRALSSSQSSQQIIAWHGTSMHERVVINWARNNQHSCQPTLISARELSQRKAQPRDQMVRVANYGTSVHEIAVITSVKAMRCHQGQPMAHQHM